MKNLNKKTINTNSQPVQNENPSSSTVSTNADSNKTIGVSKISVIAPTAGQKKQQQPAPTRNTDYAFSQKSINESAS